MNILKRHVALLVTSAALLVVIAWQFRENRRLQRALAARPHTATAPATAEGAPVGDSGGDASERARVAGGKPSRDPASMLGKLDQAIRAARDARPDPSPAGGGDDDSRESRREQRQKFIRMMLGRLDGESDEAYRARVAPLVTFALARPRERFEQRRKDFEAAAELTPEQHDELDRAVADAHGELLALANKSIAAGDLTPYKRNPRGVLAFLGGAVTTVDSVDARLKKSLSAQQLELMDQTGFDLVEYLGVTAPWEKATPPPAEAKTP
ncbi:MAG: hypothetical protein IT370_29385 [Deltaproteobacteria bacterium]|nr:hypothetical protein [Deltaproteobacteria bacterium]